MIPAPIETRCSFCFAVTDGSEFCSDDCARFTREYDEAVVVYPHLSLCRLLSLLRKAVESTRDGMNRNAANMQRMRAKRRAAGQCIDCGEPSPRFRCAVCRKKQAGTRIDRSAERIKRGLCTRCANRREPGRTMCGVCLDYYRGRKSRERDAVELVIAVVAAAVGA